MGLKRSKTRPGKKLKSEKSNLRTRIREIESENQPQVLPDHLPRPPTYCLDAAGDEAEEAEDDQLYRQWLSSSIRCWLDSDGYKDAAQAESPPKLYRLSTYWWLVMYDGSLRGRTSQGLKAFLPMSSRSKQKIANAFLINACILLKGFLLVGTVLWKIGGCLLVLALCSFGSPQTQGS